MEKELEKCHCNDCHCEEDKECTNECCSSQCESNCECDNCECENCDCGENELENKIKELEEKLNLSEEKSLREKAEMINYRRRKDEEVARIIKYSNEDIIKQILPTIDNFERAIKLDNENLDDELSKFLEGFKMIYCSFVSVLENFEVKTIDGKNKPFDPSYHEAVMTDKVEGVEPGIVIEVLQKGYILKDKVIRPAMVKVSE